MFIFPVFVEMAQMNIFIRTCWTRQLRRPSLLMQMLPEVYSSFRWVSERFLFKRARLPAVGEWTLDAMYTMFVRALDAIVAAP